MSIFIQAHQDDWQLCMGGNAYDDLMAADGNKVLFLYLTAGNADGTDVRHWQSRENGARASVRHILHNIRKHQHAETHEVRNYNGRPFECFSIDTVSSIFLRIPDVVKGPSALQQLEKGISVTSLGPAGNTFLNWDDFISTLVEIVKTEGMDQLDTIWFNAIKNNRSSGHRDHKLTAKAVAGVASIIANSHPDKIVKIAWFEGTARKMFTHDENIHKRVAALLAYEAEILKQFPDGTHCTLSEPLINARKLLLKETYNSQCVNHKSDFIHTSTD